MALSFINETQESVCYDFILDNELVSKEALDLGIAVGGNNVDTLNYIIYYSTGYHDIEQLYSCEKDNFYFSDTVKDWFIDEEESEDEEE